METESSLESAEVRSGSEPIARRVAFLISTLAVGGSETKTVHIANELRRRGHPVSLIYLNPPSSLRDRIRDDIPTACLGRHGKFSVASVLRLRDILIKDRVSRIICVNLYPLLYALSARQLLPRNLRPMVILAVNTTRHLSRKNRLQMAIYRPLIRRAARVVFGCKAQLELWCKQYGIDGKKCEVIYNGVDVDTFSPAAEEGESLPGGVPSRGHGDSRFLIGAVGQLRPEKNHIEVVKLLVRIRDRVPAARVVIAGEGPERPRLEAAAGELGLRGRISLLGQVEDVRPLLAKMDLFVLPSLSETFSNAALEAMSMGKAVVLSDTGGAREMVSDGEDGFIYSPGDLNALASIVETLAVNSDLRLKVGQAAREKVIARFSFGAMVSSYERLVF